MDEQSPLHSNRSHAAQEPSHAVVVDLSPVEDQSLHPKQFPVIITGLSNVSPSDFQGLDVRDDGNCIAECRICQEEEDIDELENPCSCSGSLKYAHRKCVQLWCNEKGDTTCEICQQPFKGGYTAPPSAQRLHNEVSIDFRDYQRNNRSIDLNDPRQLLAIAASQQHILERLDSEESSCSSADSCRCIAFIMLAFLLLHQAFIVASASADQNASMFYILFVLRAAGFLLPFYVIGHVMTALQNRHQRQDSAVLATEVAIFLRTRRMQRFSISHRQSQAEFGEMRSNQDPHAQHPAMDVLS